MSMKINNVQTSTRDVSKKLEVQWTKSFIRNAAEAVQDKPTGIVQILQEQQELWLRGVGEELSSKRWLLLSVENFWAKKVNLEKFRAKIQRHLKLRSSHNCYKIIKVKY